MEEIKILIEDYERRLNTIDNQLEKGGNTREMINRLNVKAGCYRTFLSELTRVLQKNEKLTPN